MSENINISRANLTEIDSIIKISEESNLSYWSREDYCAEIKEENSVFLTAKDKHSLEIIGFITSRLIMSNINVLEIYNIGVKSDHKRRGVGQIIFDEIINICLGKNISEIWLDVRKSNFAAIGFYRKNNFEVEYQRKNFYNNPSEDGYVMCCRIRTERL
jgi:[ribosomal protein S18]-alanine N-acetyltransferase